MTRIGKFMATAGLLAAVSAQSTSSVTKVFMPFADDQPLVASVIGQSGDVKTLVMQCSPGTDADDCGFPEPITYTAGPSTVHFQPTGIYEDFGEIDCKITGTTAVACALTVGLYTTLPDDGDITTPAASSTTTTALASGSDVSFIDVTITAVAKAAASPTGTSSSASTRGASGSGNGSGASSTATSSSTSARATSNGGSKVTVLGAMILAAPLLLV